MHHTERENICRRQACAVCPIRSGKISAGNRLVRYVLYGAEKYLAETGLCTCTKKFGAATLVRKSGIAYDYLNKEKQETE